MNKNIKSLIAVCVALCVMFTLGACKKKEEVANPMHESTYEEVTSKTGANLPAPEGATDVKYYYYDATEENGPLMAEMTFKLGDNEYTLRAQSTSLTSISIEGQDVTSLTPDVLKEKYGDISGMNYEWDAFATTFVQNCDAYYAYTKAGQGICVWLDVAPGFVYSLSMSENATSTLLVETANAVFVPMQGEVG